MSEDLNLYDYQQQKVDEFPERHALIWDTGTGKTRTAIGLANKANEDTLVICPKSVRQTWTRRMSKFADTEYTIMTKEEFRADWKDLPDFPAVIVDEAHFFFGTTSQMMKSLRYYFRRHDTTYRWLLTGTPYRSDPMDVYIMASHLGHNMDYDKFRQRFFEKQWFGRNTVWQPKDDIEDEIAELVNRFGSIRKKEQAEENVHEVEYIEPTDEQQEAIEDVDDVEAIVRFTKEHQICGGVLAGDEYNEDQMFETNKMERLNTLTADMDKMIVVCRYRQEVEMIADGVMMDNVYTMTGDTDNRQELLDNVQDEDSYVLVVSAALSEGWELPECNNMIFWSLDFQLKNYIQMQGRIDRVSHETSNYYLHLLTDGTIDEGVYESMQAKKDFHVAIYAKDNGYSQT
jgi:superfamily II DNA or RNA helicase